MNLCHLPLYVCVYVCVCVCYRFVCTRTNNCLFCCYFPLSLSCITLTATSSAHLEDLAYLDEQRHTPLRTSLRMPRQSTTCGPGRSGQDLRGELTRTQLCGETGNLNKYRIGFLRFCAAM